MPFADNLIDLIEGHGDDEEERFQRRVINGDIFLRRENLATSLSDYAFRTQTGFSKNHFERLCQELAGTLAPTTAKGNPIPLVSRVIYSLLCIR